MGEVVVPIEVTKFLDAARAGELPKKDRKLEHAATTELVEAFEAGVAVFPVPSVSEFTRWSYVTKHYTGDHVDVRHNDSLLLNGDLQFGKTNAGEVYVSKANLRVSTHFLDLRTDPDVSRQTLFTLRGSYRGPHETGATPNEFSLLNAADRKVLEPKQQLVHARTLLYVAQNTIFTP